MQQNCSHMSNKKVLLRENTRGIPTAEYPVHGFSARGEGAGGRRMCPNLGRAGGGGEMVRRSQSWSSRKRGGWGVDYTALVSHTLLLVDKQTHGCENITSTYPSDAVGNEASTILLEISGQYFLLVLNLINNHVTASPLIAAVMGRWHG